MRSGLRGFTVIELMLGLVIAGILGGTTIWAAHTILPGYRLVGAASRFHFEARSGAALAARLNKPVALRVSFDEGVCKEGYVLESEGRIYARVCLDDEFPGVSFLEGTQPLTCPQESHLSQIPPCSLCDGGSITFLPTGEVLTDGDGASVVFNLAKDGATLSTHARAVGVRRGLGRTRIYTAQSNGWACQ